MAMGIKGIQGHRAVSGVKPIEQELNDFYNQVMAAGPLQQVSGPGAHTHTITADIHNSVPQHPARLEGYLDQIIKNMVYAALRSLRGANETLRLSIHTYASMENDAFIVSWTGRNGTRETHEIPACVAREPMSYQFIDEMKIVSTKIMLSV